MSEAIEPTERTSEKTRKKIEDLEKRVQALETAATALIKAMQAIEEETEEAYMPEGAYFGIEFRD